MNCVLLKDGKITFDSDHLTIEDKAKRKFFVSFLLIIFPTFYGIMSVLSYGNAGDKVILFSGILLCLLAAIAVTLWIAAIFFKKGIFYRKHYERIIPYEDIDYVNMKRPVVALIVEIILKNRKIRRVLLKDEKANAEAFQEFLQAQQVSVQVEPFTF